MPSLIRRSLIVATVLTASAAPTLVMAHEGHGKPQHGGVTADAGGYDWELVLKPGSATLHLSDHGKPVDIKGAKGKLTVLSGGKKFEADLVSNGKTFEGTGEFAPAKGTKAIAVLTMPAGKPVTARFEIK